MHLLGFCGMKLNPKRSMVKRKGQTLVEAAIALPLFILILAGILDFGWLLANQLMVSNGSRDGARYAIVNSDNTSLASLVDARVRTNPGLDTGADVTVSVAFSADQQDIIVTVGKKVQVLTPLVGVFVKGQQIDLHSTTVMRVE
ncbi:MAG: pilus assembly protein [Clostridia bacterium]|nr:pilus assembly protein [Clostridia bacterium]